MTAKFLLIACTVFLASCAQQSFPMRNPQTGEQVVCGSGLDWRGDLGQRNDVLMACIHACERNGFRAEGVTPDPMKPPRDMAVLLPKACQR